MDKTQQSGGGGKAEARGLAESRNGGGVAPAPPTRSPRAAGSGGGGGARRDGGERGGGGTSPSAGAEVSDAIGHHQVRDIKRGDGQSAVKSAAYITGESIFDGRVGLTFGRALSAGRVLDSGTVGPKETAWTASQLWSAAETAETRRNSRVAQEHIVALPSELDAAAHKRLLNGYSLWLRDTHGVAATWALHAPSPHGDQRNIHGHILITTRVATARGDGLPQMEAKVRALSGNRTTVAAEIEHQRREWAKRVNAELERAGSPRRADHRSHARRAEAGDGAPDIEPGAHRGAAESAKQHRDLAQRQKATAAEQSRIRRNQAQAAVWQALGANSAATTALKMLAQKQHDNEQAAEAAKWAEKKAHDWEKWRAAQKAETKSDARH